MSDFFVTDKPQAEKPVRKAKKMDSSAIPVKLSTTGLLTAPAVLHVRDYTMNDALRLSLANEEELLDVIVEVVNGMIQEGFDARYLHEKELEEILLTVYSAFWNSVIQGFPYPWTEEELSRLSEDRQEAIRSGKEVPRIDVPIAAIQTDTIMPNFKEPVRITIDDYTVEFLLPRIGDILSARDVIATKFANEEKKYEELKSILEYNESVNNDPNRAKPVDYGLFNEYRKYVKRKGTEHYALMQSMMLHKVGSKKLDTPELKRNWYEKIDLLFWRAYNTEVEKLKFGVNPMVKVVSPLTGDEVTRRFQFRILEYLPTDESRHDSGYVVSFGD